MGGYSAAIKLLAVVVIIAAVPSNARVFLGNLRPFNHEVRGAVYAVACDELVIENFYYDGLGPAVRAWVGNDPTDRPSGSGVEATVTVEGMAGSFKLFPNRRFTDETLRIKLPPGRELNKITWFSIWCKVFFADFGSILIGSSLSADICSRRLYCQKLRDDYAVCWQVNKAAGSVEITTCANELKEGYFMGFGISGSDFGTQMFGADPTLCWRDESDKWRIEDFHISAYAQCGTTGGDFTGVCPDTRYIVGDNNVTGTSGESVDGISSCTYTRPLTSADVALGRDRTIGLDKPQPVVWALGLVIRNVILKHPDDSRAVPNVFVDFNGSDTARCRLLSTKGCCRNTFAVIGTSPGDPDPDPTTNPITAVPPTCSPCHARRNKLRRSRHLVFTIGPTKGACGFERLSNTSGGWGIAWYVNGCLIPDLTMKRRRTYSFCVNGGNDTSNPSIFHPLYITSSNFGAYLQVPGSNETIYAGINENTRKPLFTGPLQQHTDGEVRDCCLKRRYGTNGRPDCIGGQFFTWRPNRRTPDEVYYQCATHAYLGWKIKIIG